MRTTKPRLLTARVLRRNYACDAQVDQFKEVFPGGAPITAAAWRKAVENKLQVRFMVCVLYGPYRQLYDRRSDYWCRRYSRLYTPRFEAYMQRHNELSLICAQNKAAARTETERVAFERQRALQQEEERVKFHNGLRPYQQHKQQKLDRLLLRCLRQQFGYARGHRPRTGKQESRVCAESG